MTRMFLARILIPVLLVQLALPLEVAATAKPGAPRTELFTWEAPNGFRVEVTARPAPGGPPRARAVLRSRSGEAMTFDFVSGSGPGPVVVIDREVLMSYRVSPRGRVREVRLHDGSEWRTARGTAPGSDAKVSLYRELAGRLAAGHSPEFVGEMSVAMQLLEQEAVLPAQNAREIISCILGVAGYILSVWGLLAGCSVGVPVTLGSSCLLAILSHEVAVASAILACYPD